MVAEDFARKIQEFKDAGNWNVLVLYAVEWTRKEPANPDAWREFGGGYLRMRQYDDALEATRKAVQMSPNDAQLWQNLGQINVALRQPVRGADRVREGERAERARRDQPGAGGNAQRGARSPAAGEGGVRERAGDQSSRRRSAVRLGDGGAQGRADRKTRKPSPVS